MVAATNGMTVREDFGSMTHSSTGTADAAIAAQMQAAVQARYIMAMRRPRDWLHVRALLLKDCARLRFAETAIYAKPIGGSNVATGLSIRFAEAALRCCGNVAPEVSILYDDRNKRLIRIQVSDLEANLTYSQDLVIEKLVEKRFLRNGQKPVSQRINSSGQPTFLVEATEGEILTKQGAEISKTLRTLVLRLLPGDIQDDCKDAIDETIGKGDAADPQRAVKSVADGFMKLNIEPAQLAEYLGDDLSRASPAQIAKLRQVFTAVKDGETTWFDLMEAKRAADKPDDSQQAPAPAEGTSRGKALGDRIKGKFKDKLPEPAQEPAQPEDAPEDSDNYHERAARMAAKQG